MKQERAATTRNYTPWYPGDVKPVREGLYQRDHSSGTFGVTYPVRFSYWDGDHWCGWAVTADMADFNRPFISSLQSLPWRGLTKEQS